MNAMRAMCLFALCATAAAADWKPEKNIEIVVPSAPGYVGVPAGSGSRIKTQVARPDPLVAPFTKGQQVGTLKILALVVAQERYRPRLDSKSEKAPSFCSITAELMPIDSST